VPIETRAELVETEVELEGSGVGLLETLRGTMRLVAPQVALSARIEPCDLSCLHNIHVSLESSVDRLVVSADPRAWDGVPAPRELAKRFGCGLLIEGSPDEILALLDRSEDGRAASGAAARGAAGTEPGPGIAVTIPVSIDDALGKSDPLTGAPPVSAVHAYRRLTAGLAARGLAVPIVLSFDATDGGEDALLIPSLVLGSLLCDGIGDAAAPRRWSGPRGRLCAGAEPAVHEMSPLGSGTGASLTSPH